MTLQFRESQGIRPSLQADSAAAANQGQDPDVRQPSQLDERNSVLAGIVGKMPITRFGTIESLPNEPSLSRSDLLSLWSPSYQTSRERFIVAATDAGASLESFSLAAVGHEGEPLSIDIATIGAKNPHRGLLVVGGLHGVEGFFGSAIQQGILEAKPVVGQGDAVSFVHCLNPFGMSHLRRANELNVDINRNFLPSSENFSGKTDSYAAFEPFLNPKHLPSGPLQAQLSLFASYIKYTFPSPIRGYQALKEGVLTGQYESPDSLFFGGHAPSQSAQIISSWLASTYSNATNLFGIDLHAGLGAWGSDSLFVEVPSTSERFRDLTANLQLPLTGSGSETTTYKPRGAFADVVPTILPHCQVDWILHEFGTYNPFRVLSALVAENAWHQAAQRESSDISHDHWTKRELLEVFNPQSSTWRNHTLQRATQLFHAAGTYLFR